MIGRNEQIPACAARERSESSCAMALRNVSTSISHENIDFEIVKGEIVGLYGLVGVGRSELPKAIVEKFKIANFKRHGRNDYTC